MGGQSTHLPLKVNISGVIPAIFASSLLLFPSTIVNMSSAMTYEEISGWKQFLSLYLSHGHPLYISVYSMLIVFFCFFYTSIIFNSEETANNLRKGGAVIVGRRPGKHTADYFEYVITRLTVLGSFYMVVVCVVPEILMSKYSIPFYLGGTSILIVVNVVMDVFAQIQTHLLGRQYSDLNKLTRLGRRKGT